MPTSKTKEQVVQEFRTQAIEAAAIRVIAHKGLEGATMQAIADEAGVAKGTIYRYFRDRAQLLERAADKSYTEVMERIEIVLSQELTLADKIRALVLTLIDFVDSHRDFFRLYLAVRYEGSDVAEESRLQRPRISLYQTYLRQLAEFLDGAIDPGQRGSIDPEKLALFMSEGINAILLQRLKEPQPTVAETEAAWITRFLVKAIAPGTART